VIEQERIQLFHKGQSTGSGRRSLVQSPHVLRISTREWNKSVVT
jgi:hypothetical protein